MPYEQRLDRTHPGCVVLMVDQSDSMREPIAGGERSKADVVADAINNLLYELVLRCVKNPAEGPRHYYDVGVFGYGAWVGSVLGGALAGRDLVSVVDIANHPVRVEERQSVVAAAAVDDATVARRRKHPVWIDPAAGNGTPMCAAIDKVGAVLHGWVATHATSFPPIVINISDGAPTDGDPTVWADRLRGLRTNDGAVLFFNVNVSALPGEPLFFPSETSRLVDEYSQLMFSISSELPGYMLELTRSQGIAVYPGARGFVLNADISSVVRFLQIGTATAHVVA